MQDLGAATHIIVRVGRMHIDKPDWVKHGDAGIYSIHAAAEGDRVVTGGGDQKVRTIQTVSGDAVREFAESADATR